MDMSIEKRKCVSLHLHFQKTLLRYIKDLQGLRCYFYLNFFPIFKKIGELGLNYMVRQHHRLYHRLKFKLQKEKGLFLLLSL